ncbi:MAG: hypothetical protein II878_04550 [Bacteroidales bacterium]|nr:hypothetical protein [Bacteroidales bacterium]
MILIVRCITIFLYLFLYYQSLGQTTSQYLSCDTSIIFDNIPQFNSSGGRNKAYICFNNESRFDIIHSNTNKINTTSLGVHTYSIISKKQSTINLTIPKHLTNGRCYIDGIFSLYDTIIVYINSYNNNKKQLHLLFFDLKSNSLIKEYIFYKTLEDINDILLLPNKKLLICWGYFGSQKPKSKFLHLSILNPNDGTIEKTIDISMSLAGLSFIQKNKQIAVTKNSILFAELGNYTIHEYDLNLEHINTIIRKDNWETFPFKTMNKILEKYSQPADRIYLLSDYWNNYSRIFRIYTSNDTLFVSYVKPHQNYGTLDIWIKQENNWVLHAKGIDDKGENESVKSNRKTIGFTSIYTLFRGKNIYTFSYDLPLELNKIETLTEKEIKEFSGTYLIDNDNVLILDIFNSHF